SRSKRSEEERGRRASRPAAGTEGLHPLLPLLKAQELDALRHDLERGAGDPLVLPGVAAEVADDPDEVALPQVGETLRHGVEGDVLDPVGPLSAAAAVLLVAGGDRETEAREGRGALGSENGGAAEV